MVNIFKFSSKKDMDEAIRFVKAAVEYVKNEEEKQMLQLSVFKRDKLGRYTERHPVSVAGMQTVIKAYTTKALRDSTLWDRIFNFDKIVFKVTRTVELKIAEYLQNQLKLAKPKSKRK